ncbi:MAG: GyrI-like domain-containing protein [bacterium]
MLAFLWVVNCSPRSDQSESVKSAEKFVAAVETLDSMTVVSLNRTGPYSNVLSTMKELKGWLESNKVEPSGTPFVFYYDGPHSAQAESSNWAVCIPVPATTLSNNEKNGVVVTRLPGMYVAWSVHTGRYENVRDTYDKLLEWLDEEGYVVTGPAVEFFISEDDVPADSMLTKVGFVVQPQPELELEEQEDQEDEGDVESFEDDGQ